MFLECGLLFAIDNPVKKTEAVYKPVSRASYNLSKAKTSHLKFLPVEFTGDFESLASLGIYTSLTDIFLDVPEAAW
jgi:hypothetical protein